MPVAALMPEMAYKLLLLTDPQRRLKPDFKDSKLATVGKKDSKYEDLEQMLQHAMKHSLSELAGPRVERSGKNTSAGSRKGHGYQSSGQNGAKKSPRLNPRKSGELAEQLRVTRKLRGKYP